MDIEMYNLIHIVFNDYRAGKFKIQAKSSGDKSNEQMFSKVLQERINYVYME